MPADCSALRQGLADLGRRLVQQGGDEAAQLATRDRRVVAQARSPEAARLGPRPPDTVRAQSAVGGATGASVRLLADTWGWRWLHGGTPRAFDPHVRLAGTVVASPTDPKLANRSGWPPVAHYHPGDHRGCLCTTVPVRVPGDPKLWRGVLTDALRAGLLTAARQL